MSVKHSGQWSSPDARSSLGHLLWPFAVAAVFGVGRGLMELFAIYRHNVSGAGITHYVIWYYCLGCWSALLLCRCAGLSPPLARVLGASGAALGVVPPLVDAVLGVPLQTYRYMYEWHPLFLFEHGTPGELSAIWGGIGIAAVIAWLHQKSAVRAIATAAGFWMLLMAIGSWLPMLARDISSDGGSRDVLRLSAALIALCAFAEVAKVWRGDAVEPATVLRTVFWVASGMAMMPVDTNLAVAIWILTPIILRSGSAPVAERGIPVSWFLAMFLLLQIDPVFAVMLGGGGTLVEHFSTRFTRTWSPLLPGLTYVVVWVSGSWHTGWSFPYQLVWVFLCSTIVLGAPWERLGTLATLTSGAIAASTIVAGLVPDAHRFLMATVSTVVVLPLVVVPSAKRPLVAAAGTAVLMGIAGMLH